ncbi:hypothetical protein VKT23_014174 [Stygiomarasmius scandens]|uniref:Uncharacterized protein n=1 Tax=Marasmiellus scandens TaxID=2682957 RepID=A0ABR1J516_9AGAR
MLSVSFLQRRVVRSSSLLFHSRYASTATKIKTASKVSSSSSDDAEKNLAEMEKNLLLMQDHPAFDPWAGPIAALDVKLPYKLFPKSTSPYPATWSGRYSTLSQNLSNTVKNAFAMAHIAGYNSFPSRDLNLSPPHNTWLRSVKDFFAFPFRIFRASSTTPDAWVSGLRQVALESYAHAQIAVARRDREELLRWTGNEYQGEMEKVVKKNSGPNSNSYIWSLHRLVSPAKILSIRAIEGHYGKHPPAVGNRLLIQALVRFETEESLEIYSPTGKPLHTPSPSSSSTPLYTSSSSTQKGKRTPAPVNRLTSYLLIEKRMFMNSNWVIRERVWPKVGAEVKA